MFNNARTFFFSKIYNPIKYIQTKIFWNKISKNLNPFYYILKYYSLNEIIEKSYKKTDISDHLITLFLESIEMDPKLILELGVRGGESTFVLERVAKLFGSKLISVDIEDCSNICNYKEWIFINKEDLEFAKEFKSWCKNFDIRSQIDVLFIDTSHIFEHTLQEIKFWFPFLSNKAKVFFHDTNLKNIYQRRDGSIDYGWDNKRGVIRALEKFFNQNFNEKINFKKIHNNWLIKHYSNCNGFTILEKL